MSKRHMRVWLHTIPDGEKARFIDCGIEEGQDLIARGLAQDAKAGGLHLKPATILTADMQAAPAPGYVTRDMKPKRRGRTTEN